MGEQEQIKSAYEQGKFEGTVMVMFTQINDSITKLAETKKEEHGEIWVAIKTLTGEIEKLKEWRWKWAAIAVLVAFFGGIVGSVMASVIGSNINKALAQEIQVEPIRYTDL